MRAIKSISISSVHKNAVLREVKNNKNNGGATTFSSYLEQLIEERLGSKDPGLKKYLELTNKLNEITTGE